jgi:putative membrane protein
MHTAAIAMTWVVAVLHVWFFVLESFLWESALGRKLLHMNREQAAATAVLARNQGVYNLILAAGVGWAAWTGWAPLLLFFLGAVVIAGVVGGLTASRTILLVQALSAAVALALVHLA